MKTEAILTQTVEQLEHLNEALVALRREFLPGQPRKFAILAEGPLEDMRRLQAEITQLIQIRIQDSMFRIQGHAVSELTAAVSAANSAKPLTNWSRTALMLS